MPATPTADLAVAVLGLGEAGYRLAADLATDGITVAAWDPEVLRAPPGVRRAEGPRDAVAGSEIVLSVTTAAGALVAARSVEPALSAGQVYADLNTASAKLKAELDRLVTPTGALFADVALLGPVPQRGLGTRAIASGRGAGEFVRRMKPLGMPVEAIGPAPGTAATLKLLRSVFMKGLAAAAIESTTAAERAGCEEWLLGEISSVLDGPGEPLLRRLLEGSRLHAGRRVDEMKAASELLRDLGVEPRIASGSAALLAELAGEEVSTP